MGTFPLIILSGIIDGVGPSMLAASALFGAAFPFFEFRSTLRSWGSAYLVAYLLAATFFQCGGMAFFFLDIQFLITTIAVHMIVGGCFIALGLYLFGVWARTIRDVQTPPLVEASGTLAVWGGRLLGIVLGILMALAGRYWPMASIMAALATQGTLPGNLLPMVSGFLVYGAISLWPAFFLIAAHSVRYGGQTLIKAWEPKKSLLLILMAAFYLGLGICLLYLFFPVRPGA
ncbi:MAG: hypothetical protein GX606_05670 [Elusimicrobia bacterium]|nr:hypothetical protein [Elusimicrobiota bacterium]